MQKSLEIKIIWTTCSEIIESNGGIIVIYTEQPDRFAASKVFQDYLSLFIVCIINLYAYTYLNRNKERLIVKLRNFQVL